MTRALADIAGWAFDLLRRPESGGPNGLDAALPRRRSWAKDLANTCR
jgi:hypothetical protein